MWRLEEVTVKLMKLCREAFKFLELDKAVFIQSLLNLFPRRKLDAFFEHLDEVFTASRPVGKVDTAYLVAETAAQQKTGARAGLRLLLRPLL